MINRSIHTRKTRFALAILLFAAAVTLQALSTGMAADAPQPAAKVDSKRLLGKWVRPDGGYIIEIKEIGKDGTLKAAYYNPRPINVARAEFSIKDGSLTVFIELRDVNYPGSKYNLKYDPGLTG